MIKFNFKLALNEPSFLIFSAMSNPMFRTMRLRNKKKDCAICGENPTMTELVDYVQFCDGSADDKVSCKTHYIFVRSLIVFIVDSR